MAQNGRTSTSGYIVKAGSGSDWVKKTSGFTEPAPKGNLNTQIPGYSSPSIDYSQRKKTNLVGDVVRPAR